MAFFPAIRGPVALLNNLPIAPQNFAPSQFAITAITYATITTVTLANGTNGVVPNYVVGQLVRLIIPQPFGAGQLNGKQGYVLSIPTTNSVIVGINSVGTDPFIASPKFVAYQQQTPPQMIAIGDTNSGQINGNGSLNLNINIPGSFENISP